MKNNPAHNRILVKAIELFNEKGIEYIGMRELAAALEMRIGNITYYFPTKDDLVDAISEQYTALNDSILVKQEGITPSGFLAMLHRSFLHQNEFRCIPFSVAHLLEQNPRVAARYKNRQGERIGAIRFCLDEMAKEKWLKEESEHETELLVAHVVFIARFWISEARISQKHLGLERRIFHYLEMVAHLMLPHSTRKGSTEIQRWLKEFELA